MLAMLSFVLLFALGFAFHALWVIAAIALALLVGYALVNGRRNR
jgi:hypothetical protein